MPSTEKKKKFVFRTFLGPKATAERRARRDVRRTERFAARKDRIETRQDARTDRVKLRKAPALAKMEGKAKSGFWSPEAVKSRQATLGIGLEKGFGAAAAIGQAFAKGGGDADTLLSDEGGDIEEGAITSEEEGPPWALIAGGVGVAVVLVIVLVMMSGNGKKKAA